MDHPSERKAHGGNHDGTGISACWHFFHLFLLSIH
jgi:hypothetical protein